MYPHPWDSDIPYFEKAQEYIVPSKVSNIIGPVGRGEVGTVVAMETLKAPMEPYLSILPIKATLNHSWPRQVNK